MGNKFTYEGVKEYVEGEIGNGCKLLSKEYINCESKMLFRCKCGNKFETNFTNFKNRNKKQCNECGRENVNKFRKYTYEEVKDFVEVESNSECKLISKEYVNINSKMLFKCKCGNIFETSFTKFKHRNKRQCNKCGLKNSTKKVTKSQEQFEKEVYDLVRDEYSVIGKYINTDDYIKMRHNTCGHEFEMMPSNFLSGQRCPKCKRPNYYRDTEYFKQEIYELVGDEYSLLNEYIDTYNYVLLRHNKCGHEWKTLPNNFLNRGSRCPKCASSKGEKIIDKYLKDSNINCISEYIFEDCKNKLPLPFDFYLPEYNICIEYDGIQHFEPVDFFGGKEQFEYQKYNDELKNTYCRNNNIDLLRIPYWEFDNIDEILDSFLDRYSMDSAM